MTLIVDVVPKFQKPKKLIREMSEGPVSEDPSTSTMVNGCKHCCVLDGNSFTTFIDHYDGN